MQCVSFIQNSIRHSLGMLKQEWKVSVVRQRSLSGAEGRYFPEMLRILSRGVRKSASSGPALVSGG